MRAMRPDVFNSKCPSREVLALLAEKWTLLALHGLQHGPLRTAELRRRLGGVSEKMLIQTLRKLERYGLILRHDFGEVPPRVEYRLTRLGRSLAKMAEAFDRWIENHVSELLAACPSGRPDKAA